MPENFEFGTGGPVSTITFSRPERRNCMTRDVMLEFEQLILRVRDDRTTRVLIVTGSGTAFSAGADVSGGKGVDDPAERARIFAARNRGLPRIIGRVFDTILRLDCMTIGAVNGFAIGGGWALAAAFDFVVASENAQFWVPEVELGVPFAGSPAEVMAKRLGPWLAKEAMIMCRHYTARELYDLGMLNKVVKHSELMTAAHDFAERLLKLPEKAATATKHVVDGVFAGPRLY
jgi:enoyl-CoA hydratase/carnithine racemase